MNFFKSEPEPDANSSISDATLSVIVAGERESGIALTPVDMSASLYS